MKKKFPGFSEEEAAQALSELLPGVLILTEHQPIWPDRKFRLDICIPDRRLAVEIQGGCAIGGRHTRLGPLITQWEKHWQLNKQGWLIRETSPQGFGIIMKDFADFAKRRELRFPLTGKLYSKSRAFVSGQPEETGKIIVP